VSQHRLASVLDPVFQSPSGLAAFYEQQPSWSEAGESGGELETARIAVPLDYRMPDGPTIDIALARHKASDPARRQGALLVVPDDPGNSGLHLTRQLLAALPKETVARFDLVGFDHRFSGHSTPFDCDLTPEESFWVLHSPRSFDAEIQFQHNIAKKAAKHGANVLPHITSHNIARDMDVIRGALHEETVSLLGHSYGTYLGALYTQMFGQHADRVVLDSVVSPRWVWRRLFLGVAASAESGLMRWAKWAATRNADLDLGATVEAVRASYDRLLEKTDREPLNLGGMPVDSGTLRILTMVLLSSDRAYAVLSDVVRVGVHGGQLEPATGGSLAAIFGQHGGSTAAAQLAILCGDRAWPRDLRRYESDMRSLGDRYPFLGAAMGTVKAGAFWPDFPREPAIAIGSDNPAASILLVQSTYDVFTDASGARDMRRRLSHTSRLVLLSDASCHRVFPFYGSTAANELVTDYLVTGTLPPSDVTIFQT
jgi:pimeloyl-ACP methyl ester carboxylesterase